MVGLYSLREKLEKIISDPRMAIGLFIALAKGFLVKIQHSMNPNVKIGKSFRVYAWPEINGPGKIIIGDKVSMRLGFLRKPQFLTHTKDAVITIGNGCVMGGTRISCVDSVAIGDEALLGSSTIIDSTIIPDKKIASDREWKERHVRPIKIGNHFWAGVNSFVLCGCHIGDECVLGAGAVIHDKEVPDRSLLMGNPARKIAETRKV
jgi:acetyltransferase-like isoleucine patch superfamily enzyme